MTRPPLALPPSGLPFLPMLPRRRPTTLRACGVFAKRSLPVVPSSPLAVWAGCPSLLRSVRLWIIGTNVVEWNSRRVTRSAVPRFEVQVVMITPGYALAPLTGTPEPANARENPEPHNWTEDRRVLQPKLTKIGSDPRRSRTTPLYYRYCFLLLLTHHHYRLENKEHREMKNLDNKSAISFITENQKTIRKSNLETRCRRVTRKQLFVVVVTATSFKRRRRFQMEEDVYADY
ncbi:hypothetical protein QVD17_30518 [Tagetes erecta]|uniref:Uncharacterized protein n=1 Tax=Tagetes erecta TaxID=13708 RepID=A0AAD8K5S5_TARER|nr:hypothetical protein QVD17_30518 [Tagetes erecta]